jgi:S1-C subfamily serine protease
VSSDLPRQPDDLWSFPMPQHGGAPVSPQFPAFPPGPPTTPSPVATPPSAPKPSRHRWRMVAVAVLGLALGAAGMSAVDLVRAGPSSLSVAAPPASTTVPTATVPTATRPPTASSSSPQPTTPTVPPASSSSPQTSKQTDLTVGLVNINTVLGFENAQAAGTGIVLRADGEVLTNNHVVDGATQIQVTVLATGTTYTATVVGTDPSDDIAVLQLKDASGLAVAPLGDSSTVQVGDAVTGIGNAGGTGRPTISAGAVLSLGQTITATDQTGDNAETLQNLIETSAQLQPGQSGGPLYDAGGKVVGIDSAGSFGGRFRARSASSSGYAIPINDALAIAKQIERRVATDKITVGTPPMLGVSAGDASGSGAVVSAVTDDTPASKIGLRTGDMIVAVDGKPIASVSDLTTALHAHKAGDKISVTWTRDGATKSASATLIAGPAN